MPAGRLAWIAAACLALAAARGRAATPRYQSVDYHDGHTRPRALAVDAGGMLVYAALSTADAVAVVDVSRAAPRLVATVAVCRFPDALAGLPEGGVLVACRFEPGLRRVSRGPSGRWAAATIDAGA